MATPVLLPKQGQSVESCLIVEWKKSPGQTVQAGEVLCEVETDKAVMEIESPAAGTLLATFFAAGDLAPVQVNIAAIGEPGESVDHLRPVEAMQPEASSPETSLGEETQAATLAEPTPEASSPVQEDAPDQPILISPRARRLADQHGIHVRQLQGTGPGGRIIERDIPVPGRAAPAPRPVTRRPTVPTKPAPAQPAPPPPAPVTSESARLSPLAKAMVDEGTHTAPPQGSGPRGRVMTRDLQPVAVPEPAEAASAPAPMPGPASGEAIARPLRGIRKRIADRMRESLHNSAQLTLNRTADARALQALRARFKAAEPATGLNAITINDLILYAVARTLPDFPGLNARLENDTVYEYADVHLGFAVDTPRGLLVPVVRTANRISLKDLADQTTALGRSAQDGSIGPDAMADGTFTVTNLGSLGIESFTPILNPPQAAILGVGAIALKAMPREGSSAGDTGAVDFVPHIHLSLTIDHQVVDGAPGAHFLHALAQRVANLENDFILRGALSDAK